MKLGGAFATLAKPIARGIDSVTGSAAEALGLPGLRTNLQTCGGCSQRETWLDNLGAAVVDMFSHRAMAEDTSKLEWVVVKTRTILVTAETAEKAEEAVAKGEGQTMGLNNQVQPKPQAQNRPPAGPLGAFPAPSVSPGQARPVMPGPPR